jgi:endonuclease G
MPTDSKKAFDKNVLLAAAGFDPRFIDPAVSLSMDSWLSDVKSMLPEVEGDKKGLLKYTNLSVLYNADRRVPFVSAYNIDGKKKMGGIRRASGFRPDTRIDKAIQLSKKGFYDLRKDITEFEIGHMAANDEMAWGSDAQLKAYQTFHFTNSVPQAEKLNTGIWKSLESYVIDEAATLKTNKRICVFSGPILRSDDPLYREDEQFMIPLLFFKVIVFPTAKGVRSTAFIMSHEQRMIEQGMFLSSPLEMMESGEGVGIPHFEDFKYRKVFQVDLRIVEDLTGMRFRWKNVKRIDVPNQKNQILKIRKIRDADDAEEASNVLEVMRVKGSPPAVLVDEDLTKREIKNRDYRLNILFA